MARDTFVTLWRDINRSLWRAAVDKAEVRSLIRAELHRRTDAARLGEKSGRHTFAAKSKLRAVYRACLWLIEEDAHYQSFVSAFVEAANAARSVGLDPADFELDFLLSAQRWVVEGTKQQPITHLSLNLFYVGAETPIWTALFTAITTQKVGARRLAERYARSHQAQAIIAVYSDLSPLKVHDVYPLSDIFDELNQEYFENSLPKPQLAWTQRKSYRLLGSYNFTWNIISISHILNDERVPVLALRFVLYHEMLHIKHGARCVSGRLISHTSAFRAEERQFKGYEEAIAIHQKLQKLTAD